jgi:hypothetical protein
MKSAALLVSALALLGLSSVALSQATRLKNATIKEIMTKAHKGGNALLTLLLRELGEDKQKWGEIQQQTAELVALAKLLAKNDPPRGDKDSWQKFTQQYLQNAKKLDDAAQRKDKQSASAARDKLGRSCTGCHRVHRPS